MSFISLFPIIWWVNRSGLSEYLVNFIIFQYLSVLAKYVKCPLFCTYLLGVWVGVWCMGVVPVHVYTHVHKCLCVEARIDVGYLSQLTTLRLIS